MSSELADAPVDEAPVDEMPVAGVSIEEDAKRIPPPPEPEGRGGFSDPAAAFLASSIVWASFLAGLARTLDYVPGAAELTLRSNKDLAWFALASASFIVVLLSAIVLIADRSRQRNTFPRGYRAPERGRPTIVEALGWLGVTAYIVAVVATAFWLSMRLIEGIGPDLAPPAAGQIILLVVLVGIFLYALIVVPAAALTVPLQRRHRRQYPDERDHDGAGFTRTTRALLIANAFFIAMVVVMEVLDGVGAFPR